MKKKDTCEIFVMTKKRFNRIQGDLQTVDISGVSQILKAIADENRAKLLTLCVRMKSCVFVI
ncbi:cadmium efflux system accessory protein CadC [Staphylococcus aureus]|nr:cadmium efflux system accessory protein CadC [Staphylococcus aureus]